MRKFLILLALLVAFSAGAQTPVRELILTGPVQDTTIFTNKVNKGWIRYDTIADKYRFWNDATNTYFSYAEGSGVDPNDFWKTDGTSNIGGDVDIVGNENDIVIGDADSLELSANDVKIFSDDASGGVRLEDFTGTTFIDLTDSAIYSTNGTADFISQGDLHTGRTSGEFIDFKSTGIEVTLSGTNTFKEAADYSANYTARSYTAKSYVDASDATKWSLVSGGTLTGVNTITSNTAQQHIFNGTWTATANNDFHASYTGAFTSRVTASDVLIAYKFNPSLTSVGASQIGVAVEIAPTFSGGYSFPTALRIVPTPTGLGNVVIGNSATTARLGVYGVGTGGGVAFLVANSSQASKVSILDSGTGTFTCTSDNGGASWFWNNTWTAGGDNRAAHQYVGTLTQSATINRSLGGIDNNIAFTTGNTGQTIFGTRNRGTHTFNHANGVLIGYDHNVTPAGTQTASLTHLAFRGTAGSKLLLGGSAITTGSVLADFQSTTEGVLFPRVTNIASVTTPVNGLAVYDAATNLFNWRENSAWINSGSFWKTAGTSINTAPVTITGGVHGITKTQDDGSGNLTTETFDSGLERFHKTTFMVHELQSQAPRYVISDETGSERLRIHYNGTYNAIESRHESFPVKIQGPTFDNDGGTTLQVGDNGVGIAVTSGSPTYHGIIINPRMDITGGTPTAYGVKYEPTLTDFAGGTHYAWRHTNGFVAWSSKISPAQITANQNDYNPTGWNSGNSAGVNGASVLRLNTDASRDLTSLTGGVDGRLVIVLNVGGFDLVIKDDDGATGTAANRFALSADITILPDDSRTFIYDGTSSRWRVIN